MTAHAMAQVLAVLDDAAAGELVLELSAALARTLRRELTVVYVESARALVAAELPFTQVLPHAGLEWQPLRASDVEQGFRAHAARLRELAARIAVRDAVHWSLRVMRGDLPAAATDLSLQSDLLFLAATPAPKPPRSAAERPARRPPVVAVVGSDGEAGARALAVARQLAQALSGVVETVQTGTAAPLRAHADERAALARADVLVLPRAALDAGTLALLRCPVLLVG